MVFKGVFYGPSAPAPTTWTAGDARSSLLLGGRVDEPAPRELGRERARIVEDDRIHPGLTCALAVLAPIVDEEAVLGRDAQRFASTEVRAKVGLARARVARDERPGQVTRERELVLDEAVPAGIVRE